MPEVQVNAEVHETLILAEATKQEVVVTLNRCQYQCCGGGWADRSGYEQTYQGRVVTLGLDGDTLLLQSAPLGRITSVLACVTDVVDARIVD